MNRTQFIEALAQEAGVEKKQAKQFLEAFTSVVERCMKAHDDVPLPGLGKASARRGPVGIRSPAIRSRSRPRRWSSSPSPRP